jgi:hypothetical protein
MPGQHTHEALQILRGRPQVKLFGHVPEPMEPHAPESHLLCEFAKERFDAITGAAGLLIGSRVRAGADRLAGRLMSMYEELSIAP